MNDPSRLTSDLAAARIGEWLVEAERHRLLGPRRARGRHAFAQRLHRIADRLDT
jgi:hypothetical protein